VCCADVMAGALRGEVWRERKDGAHAVADAVRSKQTQKIKRTPSWILRGSLA